MMDENRDPDLESVRAEWQAPAPGAGFHARVLGAFEDEFVRVPWWRRRWVIAGAVVAMGVVLAMAVLRREPAAHYEPVRQPHFMIVSAGEHP